MKKYYIGLLVALVLVGVHLISSRDIGIAQGSIAINESYLSTTTPKVTGNVLLRSGQGQLGSVVVTAVGSTDTGTLTLLDATTTDVTKRNQNAATTTLILADFPGMMATGTYQFDVQYVRGLLFVSSGEVGTSTITFK